MKSTLASALALEAVHNELSVSVVDLDPEHRTITEWMADRVESGIEPTFQVHEAENAAQALQFFSGEDLYIIDCPSRATAASLEIAKNVDLVIQPSTPGKKDLDLSVKTFHQLVGEGIPVERLLLILTRVGTPAEFGKAKEYFKKAETTDGQRFRVLPSAIYERPAYRASISDGYAITETPYVSLNEVAKSVIYQSITVLNV
jgi:chromosome partitioning protein